MTYHSHAVLLDRPLDKHLDPLDAYWHDWMHGLFVDGICNVCIYLLLKAYFQKGHTPVYQVFSDYIAKWKWPGRVNSKSLHECVSQSRRDQHSEAQHIKCQASDLLSLMGVLAMFIQHVLVKLPNACVAECRAVLVLVDVVDLIAASSRVTVPLERLLDAIEKFLELFEGTWGLSWMTPKFQWLVHIASVFEKTQTFA